MRVEWSLKFSYPLVILNGSTGFNETPECEKIYLYSGMWDHIAWQLCIAFSEESATFKTSLHI
jgi:hypothetical protein